MTEKRLAFWLTLGAMALGANTPVVQHNLNTLMSGNHFGRAGGNGAHGVTAGFTDGSLGALGLDLEEAGLGTETLQHGNPDPHRVRNGLFNASDYHIGSLTLPPFGSLIDIPEEFSTENSVARTQTSSVSGLGASDFGLETALAAAIENGHTGFPVGSDSDVQPGNGSRGSAASIEPTASSIPPPPLPNIAVPDSETSLALLATACACLAGLRMRLRNDRQECG